MTNEKFLIHVISGDGMSRDQKTRAQRFPVTSLAMLRRTR